MKKPNDKAVLEALTSINNVHGKGVIVGIVWGVRGADVDLTWTGMAVRQMQYSMDAKKFFIWWEGNQGKVDFLRKAAKIGVKNEK